MPSPSVTFKDTTNITIEFGHFYQMGGPSPEFQLNITNVGLNESRLMTYQENFVSLSLDDLQWAPECNQNETEKKLYPFVFTVRAVTTDISTGRKFYGDWSPAEIQNSLCKGELSKRMFSRKFI